MKRISLPLMAILALGLTQASTRAFNPQPEPPAFGMIGLARGQFAVLSAVLVGPPDDGTPPPDDQLPPPDDNRPACRLILAFVGADGRTLVDAAGLPTQKTVALRGGIAGSLMLRATDVLGTGQLRRPIRAVVVGPPDDDAPSDCRGLVATMELVNALGWTEVLYAPAVQPPDPVQPPPDDNLR